MFHNESKAPCKSTLVATPHLRNALVIKYPTTSRQRLRVFIVTPVLREDKSSHIFAVFLSQIMGLPLTMDSMHAPTIPSGPTSRGSANGIKTAGKTLQELQAQKDSLEAELKALSGVLDSVCQLELLS
jgi:hypothetical protein